MPTTMKAAQVAAHQATHGCPLLFPDTCSLLDLVRLPVRTLEVANLRRELEAGLAVLQAIRVKPAKVAVVLAPPVPQEFADHLASEVERVDTHFDKHREYAEVLSHTQATLGASAQMAVVATDLLRETSGKLRALAEELVDESIHLDQVAGFGDRAMTRVVRRIAPASRGKESKDCLIIEHVLDCRAQCPTGSAVFISSNTRDYCASGSTKALCPPLDSQFADVNLEYRVNWQATRAALGL